MEMAKEYTIGLDIGTNSVGWAVMQNNYDLVRKSMPIYGNTDKKKVKKNFWGVRLFDEGLTAEDRRMSRTARRRYTRRHYRINTLQRFFQDEMKAVDENFFYRLDESFLVPEDKLHERHPIFATLEEEKAYHENYPTIYHLREAVANSTEKMDLRLVYLAMAHIIKYRGHFLIEGALNTENTSIEKTFDEFRNAYNSIIARQPSGELINPLPKDVKVPTLSENYSRARKADNTLKLFPGEKSNGTFAQFLKLIVGNQNNIKKTFELEEDAKLQASKETFDEDLEALLGQVGDEYADVFVAAKNVYDAIELAGILTVTDTTSKAKLSASMVKRYDDHKADLKKFKLFILENAPDLFYDMFKNEGKNGYAWYISTGSTNQEEFYKYVTAQISGITGSAYFLSKIENEDFLRKQRTFDNGVIPHQIHQQELAAMLEAQGQFYPFLKENNDNIITMFSFRIPYFVGPLAKGHSDFAWLTRKSDEAITPWNFDKVIDLNQSAVDFIEKMTNFDTYLPTEKVLPKHSMLYEKYAIFNELTKVRYLDEREVAHNFSSVEKVKIFEELFKKNRKVSLKIFTDYVANEYGVESAVIEGIGEGATGKNFNSSYGTYHDLSNLGISTDFLDDPKNAETLENLVKLLTVFEDRKMLREQIENLNAGFSAPVMKKLERRHYSGWGRLSAKLIDGLLDKRTGKTILDFLMNDDGMPNNPNRNFMQLINDDNLSFKEQINQAQMAQKVDNLELTVQELAGSPAIKRGILQSLKIVDELVQIMGYAPKNIVVEMARENQVSKNSRPRLKALEEAMKEMGSELLKLEPTDNKQLANDRLYLYYLQNGKDLYTGKDLDIDKLSTYDIDHIIPQSFITDDSIDNRVLVSSSKNRGKSDNVPSEEVANAQFGLWNSLFKSGLMSKKKFDNLTKGQRGGLSEDDKAGFIKRQLVETRQITKNVAQILDKRFNTEKDEAGKIIRNVNIISLKSSLASQFRKTFSIYKVREINDYHHAHDAYLNCVVANALLNVYPQLRPEFVYGEYKNYNSHEKNRATAKKQFYTNIMKFFSKEETITDKETGEIVWDKKIVGIVKRVIGYHQMNIVKKTEIQKGQFSKASIQPKGESKKLIPRKVGWDTTKYGGFDSPIVAYSVVFSHVKGKANKIVSEILGITIRERETFENNEVQFLMDKGYRNPKVIIKLPKYALYHFEDGRRRLLASATEAQKGNQMFVPTRFVELLYRAKHVEDTKEDNISYLNEHREEFAEVLEYVNQFTKTYILAEKNLEKVNSLYAENRDGDIKDIAQSFINLMTFTAMGAPADFKFFGTTIPRKRYTSVNELLNAIIIDQSITGLYETYTKLGD